MKRTYLTSLIIVGSMGLLHHNPSMASVMMCQHRGAPTCFFCEVCLCEFLFGAHRILQGNSFKFCIGHTLWDAFNTFDFNDVMDFEEDFADIPNPGNPA